MTKPAASSGLAVIDKPAGWTSHDVVAKCRGIFGTKKVGHSGTLDPMATGVLVLGVGRGTRLMRFLSGLPKTYEAGIAFGVETDSLDADGEVTATHQMAAPTEQGLAAAAAELTGDIRQVPPMVSAVKVGGRRLHQLAREGKEVRRDPRPVTVSRFELAPTEDPMVWRASIDCSSGTYVRVLAADLGHALGGGAHLCELRRTAVGPFGVEEAEPMESATVLPLAEIARVLQPVGTGEEQAALVANGQVLSLDSLGVPAGSTGPWAVLGPDGTLLAVYEPHRSGYAKPAVVTAG
jgi:tRNA pseudouridine55 synthase